MFKGYKYYILQYQGKLCKKYEQKNKAENYTKCQQWLLWDVGDMIPSCSSLPWFLNPWLHITLIESKN